MAFLLPGAGEALSNPDVQRGRRQALVVVLSQVLIGALVATVCCAVAGVRAGASALLGTGIGVAATSLMALAMLRHGEGVSAVRATIGFLTGWLIKVGLTVALLVMAFRSPKVDAVPLLAAYVATFFGYWVGSARSGGQQNTNT
ncbi:MAG TPA: ATP synthase subunit I [Steroidobacteraceae bacterium]|nr:ATP synthase subunit I [Steroidobacteraceae bacterium]